MRTLQTSITTQINGSFLVFDLDAIGARACNIVFKNSGAPGTGQIQIDDMNQNLSGNIVSRIATVNTQTSDTNSPDFIRTWLTGNVLQIVNNSLGTVRAMVTLYDELTIPPAANYTSNYISGNLAALASVSTPLISPGRAWLPLLLIDTNRATTITLNVRIDSTGTNRVSKRITTAAATGFQGVEQLGLIGQSYFLTLTNDDAALAMTYMLAVKTIYGNS